MAVLLKDIMTTKVLTTTAERSVVEVTATAATLETSSSSLVANVDDKSVQEMPMNGRDFTQMVKLAPGSTPIGTVSTRAGSAPSAHAAWVSMRASVVT